RRGGQAARRGRLPGRNHPQAARRDHGGATRRTRGDRQHGGRGMSTAATHAPLLETYARTDVTFVRGDGAWLEDDDGRRYLDLVGGIAVVGLGHRHPAPLAAAHAQLDRLWHVSNLYWNEPMSELAALLSGRFGGAS